MTMSETDIDINKFPYLRLHGFGGEKVMLFAAASELRDFITASDFKPSVYDKELLEAAETCQGMSGYLFDEENNNGCHFVLISHKYIDVVVHEVNHLCLSQLNGMGVEVTQETQEVFCYLSDYLTNKICKMLGITEFSEIEE